MNDPLTFSYASQQKYFINIQWHKEKTFKHECNTMKINNINKQCQDVDVAEIIHKQMYFNQNNDVFM